MKTLVGIMSQTFEKSIWRASMLFNLPLTPLRTLATQQTDCAECGEYGR